MPRRVSRAFGHPPQLTAFFTSAVILASSAAVNPFSAKAVGHRAPSSRFASSLKPNVAYLVLNFCALWKKQTTLPPLAYAGIPYQSLGARAGALAAWPGWNTCWQRDRYEMQLERAGGLLRFPVPGRQALLARCREMLLWQATASPVDTIKTLAESERKEGRDVQVNPWALRDDRVELSPEERAATLEAALLRLEARRRQESPNA